MVFSHSKLSTYEQCPRKYAFAYVEKPELEEEFESVQAFLGIRVHEALERLYTDHRQGRLLTPEELLAFYNSEWERNWRPEIKIVRKELKPEHYRASGEKQLRGYYARHEPEFTDETRKTVGVERLITFSIGEKKQYHIQGYIDRLSYNSKTGAYEIHDYKTSASLPPQPRLDSNRDEGRQLGLYNLGVRHSWPDAKSVTLHWHFLVFDKEMTSKRSQEQLDKLSSSTVQLIQQIERAKEAERFPTHVTELCNYCPYQRICPAWKHLLETEGMPLNKFLKEPAVKLVNEYAKTKKALDEYKAEKEAVLENLREALLAYAKKHGVEAIRGSEYYLQIKPYEVKKLAPEDSPEYERLVEALKKAGQFEEYAHLNASQLRNAMESGELQPEAQQALRKALTVKRTEQLRLRVLEEGED